MKTSTRTILIFGLFSSLVCGRVALADPTSDVSCIRCHGDPEYFDDSDLTIVEGFKRDVHAEAGLSCHSCHGGNPDPSVADDSDAAMDADFPSNPYRGAPDRGDIPAFCGRCHSDAAYMRQFRPDYRIDQEAEYRSSHHGQALASGDGNVATCISCHGVHGILSVKDPDAPVYPTHVADTCRGCHGNAETMAGYVADDGTPLPVDQYQLWSGSVHAAALLQRGDLSAPTCNDCHGNHGAAPPGLQSVALVCGQCHGREAELFRASPKRVAFEDHNDLLADATDGCRDCHDAPEPPAGIRIRHFTECATCHGNHAVLRPTVAMLGSLPATPCAFCHEGAEAVVESEVEPERIREHYGEELGRLMKEADALQLTGDALFDWLVDRALELPPHTAPGPDRDTGSRLRPEFEKLFGKFRIGKTRHVIQDSTGSPPTVARVVQCTDCHGSDGEGTGHDTAVAYLTSMHDLTSRIARTERVLLAARRGGVEVGEGLLDLDRAVGTQVELQALVHTFDADTSGAFVHKQREGLAHADDALRYAQSGLMELSNRRRGLVVALGLIVLLLAGLGIKIRSMGA